MSRLAPKIVLVVAVLALQVWIAFSARWILLYEVAALFLVALVSSCVATYKSRRRGMRVAHTLRPDAAEFVALQDDFLGRVQTTSAVGGHQETVSTQCEVHGDPDGDLTEGESTSGDPATSEER